MATSTHTTDLGIKKIGTGLEAGTWGESTSQNFERVSAALGLAVSMAVTNLPPGSASVTGLGVAPNKTAPSIGVWTLTDTADSPSDPSSYGRCSAVEFTDTQFATGQPITIRVRGNTSANNVNRTFVVWNNLGNSNVLKLDCNGGEIIIRNGCMALVNTNPTGNWLGSPGVANLLSKAQFDDIVLAQTTGSIEFVGTGTVTIPVSPTALVVNDGTTDLVKIDSSAGAEVITLDAATAVTIDVGAVNTNPATIVTHSGHATALTVTDGTSALLTVDTTGVGEIEIGTSGAVRDLRVHGETFIDGPLNLKTAATEIRIKDNEIFGALFLDGASTLFQSFNTSANIITMHRRNSFSMGLNLGGTLPAYINSDATNIGATGNGLRVSSTSTMEAKHDTKTWNKIPAALVAVDEAGAATQIIENADGGLFQEQQGCIDIGPVRIIFNTIATVNPVLDVILGTTLGTSATMNSALWSVMLVDAGAGSKTTNTAVRVTDSAAGKFRILSSNADPVTYWAIGDSGA